MTDYLDGRPSSRKKGASSNFSGVLRTLTKYDEITHTHDYSKRLTITLGNDSKSVNKVLQYETKLDRRNSYYLPRAQGPTMRNSIFASTVLNAGVVLKKI